MTQWSDTPSEDETYQSIGEVLLGVQTIERMLAGCLMCSRSASSAESKLRKLLQRDRECLGDLLNEFRKVASLPEDFEETLKDFLESRNVFVHRLLAEDWVDINTAKGRKVLQEFLWDLMDKCIVVKRILLGYMLVVSQGNHQLDSEAEEYIRKISWGIARTSTVLFDDLPEDYFGDLFAEVRDQFAPHIRQSDRES